jgi:glycosyltransferase involved in cell wall biosynthesis
MQHPLVSIGIPTYNRAEGFLEQAINSARGQNYPNIEIIIGDNCSQDRTGELVQSFADPRIRYYRHENNIGPENNFNFCLDQANGAYFLLLHDDDLIDPDFVDTCMQAAIHRTHYGLIRTGIRVINEYGQIQTERENRTKGETFEDKLMAWFTHQSPWYFCNTLFNTKALKQDGGLRSKRKLLQDGVAVTKLHARLPSIDVAEIKASFRKHHGEITFAVRVKDWVDDFLDLLALMVALAPPASKGKIQTEGHRFFANLSYGRAKAVQNRWSRWITYWLVYREFGFKYPPPLIRTYVNRVRDLFRGNTLKN